MSVKVAKVTSATATAREVRSDMGAIRHGTSRRFEGYEDHEERVVQKILRVLRMSSCLRDDPCQRFFRSRQPSGGIVRRSEYSNPCAGTGSAVTLPPLPTLLPPYSEASLFSNST